MGVTSRLKHLRARVKKSLCSSVLSHCLTVQDLHWNKSHRMGAARMSEAQKGRSLPALEVQDSNHTLNKMSFYWVNFFLQHNQASPASYKKIFTPPPLSGQKNHLSGMFKLLNLWPGSQELEVMSRIRGKKIWTEKVPWIKFVISTASRINHWCCTIIKRYHLI